MPMCMGVRVRGGLCICVNERVCGVGMCVGMKMITWAVYMCVM